LHGALAAQRVECDTAVPDPHGDFDGWRAYLASEVVNLGEVRAMCLS